MIKKNIMALLCLVLALMALTACSGVDTVNNTMFIEIEKGLNWKIVYHKDTKVMYVVSNSSYNHGTFTLLVDKNGDPMLYEE